jgi:hypothetical protein
VIDLFASQNLPPSPQPKADKDLAPTPEPPPPSGLCVTTSRTGLRPVHPNKAQTSSSSLSAPSARHRTEPVNPQTRDSLEFPARFAGNSVTVPVVCPKGYAPAFVVPPNRLPTAPPLPHPFYGKLMKRLHVKN